MPVPGIPDPDVAMPPTSTSTSGSPPLASPNRIPPRTSSSGLYRNSLAAAVSGASASGPAAGLDTVSEAAWLGQSQNQQQQQQQQRRHTTDPTPRNPSSGVTIMHNQENTAAPDHRRYADEDLDFAPQRSWTLDKEKVVRAPFDYVSSHPGKDFRTQLIAAFNALLDVPADRLDVITRVVGMLHESSLLVDDVQDSSELRRGFPVAHHIFGVAQTINSANYVYFVALQELQKLHNPRLVATFADELVNLHRGQGMDLFWRDTLTCPTEEDYLEMVGNKTGGLFRLGIKLMQEESPVAGKGGLDCVPLVNLIGLIFQIRDDYMNLSSGEYSDNKGLCEDLTEGKFSFPVIHAIRADPANMQLINILKQKTSDVQVKRYAVRYMEGTGSFEYTRAVIGTLIDRARVMARAMEDGSKRTDGVQRILDRMVVE